jgi:twitching motility protein PilU
MILGELIMEKRGLLLMVGSTGAGKSTTLASMIDHRNESVTGHILTIEDPVEFIFRNKKCVVNQREVGSDTQSLQTALKNALRQAPDVILIGEIRDRETMSAAIAYAQSGHLCLATMHANNSYQALNRILSFYPVEVRPTMLGDLAAAMKAIVSQRLLRTVAGSRAPAVEVMLNTKLISELIEKGDFSGVKEAMEKSMAEGSQTFEQDIARMIMDGIVDKKEGLAYADSPTNLQWRLQNSAADQAQAEAAEAEDDGDDQASFTEITLDVKHYLFTQKSRRRLFSSCLISVARTGGAGSSTHEGPCLHAIPAVHRPLRVSTAVPLDYCQCPRLFTWPSSSLPGGRSRPRMAAASP